MFRVINVSGQTLTLARAWGTSGWPQMADAGFVDGDVAPPVNTALRPGQEMVFAVCDSGNHGMNARFTSPDGRQGTVYMHVDSQAPRSDAQGFDGNWETAGSDVAYLGAPGSVVDIPASDAAAQTEVINSLGRKAGPGTTFTPTSIVEKDADGRAPRSERQPFGPGVKNFASEAVPYSWYQHHVVDTTASIDIDSAAKPVMDRAVQNALKDATGQHYECPP